VYRRNKCAGKLKIKFFKLYGSKKESKESSKEDNKESFKKEASLVF
jgi:hypothetical protein